MCVFFLFVLGIQPGCRETLSSHQFEKQQLYILTIDGKKEVDVASGSSEVNADVPYSYILSNDQQGATQLVAKTNSVV